MNNDNMIDEYMGSPIIIFNDLYNCYYCKICGCKKIQTKHGLVKHKQSKQHVRNLKHINTIDFKMVNEIIEIDIKCFPYKKLLKQLMANGYIISSPECVAIMKKIDKIYESYEDFKGYEFEINDDHDDIDDIDENFEADMEEYAALDACCAESKDLQSI